MEKFGRLTKILREIGSAVIAYSGGTDSSLLVKAAHDCLTDPAMRLLAVTARSNTYPESEFNAALEVIKLIGAPHRVIHSEELNIPGFADNPPERCFYCKDELFGILASIARDEGYGAVCDGSNLDDMDDYRPGRKAGEDYGVRSPLVEAGMTKDDVRFHARRLGLPNWNKPAAACLASRFPYGTRITAEKLKMVEKAEELVKGAGFSRVRVRHHDGIARIEIDPSLIVDLVSHPDYGEMVNRIKSLGFDYVTLDMEGYRTGSLNEVLKK